MLDGIVANIALILQGKRRTVSRLVGLCRGRQAACSGQQHDAGEEDRTHGFLQRLSPGQAAVERGLWRGMSIACTLSLPSERPSTSPDLLPSLLTDQKHFDGRLQLPPEKFQRDQHHYQFQQPRGQRRHLRAANDAHYQPQLSNDFPKPYGCLSRALVALDSRCPGSDDRWGCFVPSDVGAKVTLPSRG